MEVRKRSTAKFSFEQENLKMDRQQNRGVYFRRAFGISNMGKAYLSLWFNN